MPTSLEAKARTRAFARVIGPFLVLVPGTLVVRAPDIRAILLAFFQNEALVWGVGTMLLIGGLLIIAYHQYWSSPAAVMISLLGWLLALRGLMLLAAPQLIARGANASLDYLPAVRIGFSLFVLIGLWLTYAGWFAKPPENGS
ncbi:MAG: hypothetical protein LLG93_02250 [Deltaproteobacteria bacterium]|nr:hypothetical protein [Deltaproteobacteria bacterium]